MGIDCNIVDRKILELVFSVCKEIGRRVSGRNSMGELSPQESGNRRQLVVRVTNKSGEMTRVMTNLSPPKLPTACIYSGPINASSNVFNQFNITPHACLLPIRSHIKLVQSIHSNNVLLRPGQETRWHMYNESLDILMTVEEWCRPGT